MHAVIDIVLPIFGIILAGYLAGRFRVLGTESSEALNGFVFYFALPALLFRSVAQIDPSEFLDLGFVAASVGASLTVYVLAVVLARTLYRQTLAPAAMFACTATFSNWGYLGIPLNLVAFGEGAMTPLIIIIVIHTGVLAVLTQVLIETGVSSRTGPGMVVDVAKALLRSPMILAPALGWAWAMTGAPLPAPVDTFCAVLGDAAGPSALFAIGLFLVGRPGSQEIRGGLGAVGATVALKLLVHPALTWVLAYRVFEVRTDWAAVAVIEAALPTGATAFVLAQNYGIFVRRASATILVTTTLSVVTLAVLLPLLR